MAILDESKLPDYKDLPGKPGLPRETTWGLFGDRYELGTLNFLTPERVREAARAVRTGKRFNLVLPLNVPNGGATRRPLYRSERETRKTYKHEMFFIAEDALDEMLHDFNPQGSTQWDGLAHVRHPRYQFYNGLKEQDIVPGDNSKLSIAKWAQTGGIIGRGVLLDTPRYCAAAGIAYDPQEYFLITPDIVKAMAAWERVEIKPGDILLFRTGWLKTHLDTEGGARPGQRRRGNPGLGPGREMAEFLWQNRVAALLADNGGVEASPVDLTLGRSVHIALLPMLGMPIGELFVLDELADDCAQDGVYECMFVSVPLNLPGGVGSPGNAIAIK